MHRCGLLQDWTLPVEGHVLRFRSDPRRRPARRTLLDSATGRAHRLDLLRAGRHLTLQAPTELSVTATVLCLWLGHLLDAHARAGHHW